MLEIELSPSPIPDVRIPPQDVRPHPTRFRLHGLAGLSGIELVKQRPQFGVVNMSPHTGRDFRECLAAHWMTLDGAEEIECRAGVDGPFNSREHRTNTVSAREYPVHTGPSELSRGLRGAG
jgi:hypothetical protein